MEYFMRRAGAAHVFVLFFFLFFVNIIRKKNANRNNEYNIIIYVFTKGRGGYVLRLECKTELTGTTLRVVFPAIDRTILQYFKLLYARSDV